MAGVWYSILENKTCDLRKVTTKNEKWEAIAAWFPGQFSLSMQKFNKWHFICVCMCIYILYMDNYSNRTIMLVDKTVHNALPLPYTHYMI